MKTSSFRRLAVRVTHGSAVGAVAALTAFAMPSAGFAQNASARNLAEDRRSERPTLSLAYATQCKHTKFFQRCVV